MTTRRPLPVLLAGLALGSTVLAAGTAHASDDRGGDDLRRSGSCSGATDWKLKAKTDDGRLEIEAEIDSNRRGQTWRWVILHNGSVSSRGVGITAGPSGSFSVERRVTDVSGPDQFVLRARNRASGETCRGALTWSG